MLLTLAVITELLSLLDLGADFFGCWAPLVLDLVRFEQSGFVVHRPFPSALLLWGRIILTSFFVT